MGMPSMFENIEERRSDAFYMRGALESTSTGGPVKVNVAIYRDVRVEAVKKPKLSQAREEQAAVAVEQRTRQLVRDLGLWYYVTKTVTPLPGRL
jgi:hypothetical protein